MFALFALAVGLAMDAFAVSLVRGATGQRSLRGALEVAIAFGAAQALMPLTGWALGQTFSDSLSHVDHWIAFVLLGFLGLRMIREAFTAEIEPEPVPASHLRGLAVAAVATSIDAAVAGVTLPLLGPSVAISCVVIGVTTAGICFAGYYMGGLVPARGGRWAETLGGLVLIALGTTILIEHLGA